MADHEEETALTSPLDYGPVLVQHPKTGLRVGYYDDDEYSGREEKAIIYYCEPPLVFTNKFHLVRHKYIAPIDSQSLRTRRTDIQVALGDAAHKEANNQTTLNHSRLYELALEYSLVNTLLTDIAIRARRNEGAVGGRSVFISHSSRDKDIAVWLAEDLAGAGHAPWLDEWQIRVGESIPVKISRAIDDCEFLILLLSPDSVTSGWVEREWSAKYWNDVQDDKITILPVLLADCPIPALLRDKKYADVRSDYRRGLNQVLDALENGHGRTTDDPSNAGRLGD